MSIINDALKKVQATLNQKDTASLQGQKSQNDMPQSLPASPETEQTIKTPIKKTLATIEQAEKEAREKNLQTESQRNSPIQNLLPATSELLKIIGLSIIVVGVSVAAFLGIFSFIKKHPLSKKMVKISTPAKTENRGIVSITHENPSSKSTPENTSPSLDSQRGTPGFPVAISNVQHEKPAINISTSTPKTTPSSTASSTAQSSSSPPLDSSSSAANFLPKIFSQKPANQTATTKRPKSNNLILKGIVTQNNHQMALINDGIYELGATVDGKKILSISTREVTILDEDRVITLSIDGRSY